MSSCSPHGLGGELPQLDITPEQSSSGTAGAWASQAKGREFESRRPLLSASDIEPPPPTSLGGKKNLTGTTKVRGGFLLGRVKVTYRPGPMETPCWIWRGCLNSKGYGIRSVGGKNYLTHRLAYEDQVRPLRPGEAVHHVCAERRCINPDHLAALVPYQHHLADAARLARQEEAAAVTATSDAESKPPHPIKEKESCDSE